MGFHSGGQKQRHFGFVPPDISGHIVQWEKSGNYHDFVLLIIIGRLIDRFAGSQ
jgi:hypothetical protein